MQVPEAVQVLPLWQGDMVAQLLGRLRQDCLGQEFTASPSNAVRPQLKKEERKRERERQRQRQRGKVSPVTPVSPRLKASSPTGGSILCSLV
jgi:hypothetical protein